MLPRVQGKRFSWGPLIGATHGSCSCRAGQALVTHFKDGNPKVGISRLRQKVTLDQWSDQDLRPRLPVFYEISFQSLSANNYRISQNCVHPACVCAYIHHFEHQTKSVCADSWVIIFRILFCFWSLTGLDCDSTIIANHCHSHGSACCWSFCLAEVPIYPPVYQLSQIRYKPFRKKEE